MGAAPDGARTEVRLAEIDAPEAAQPYGADARAASWRGLVARKYMRMEQSGPDRYGRTSCASTSGKLDVNAEMVRSAAPRGCIRQYLRDPSFPALEDEARAHRLGLWALPASERVPPWEWRRSHPRDQRRLVRK